MIGLESEALRQHVAQTVADFYLAESNEAKAEGIIFWYVYDGQNILGNSFHVCLRICMEPTCDEYKPGSIISSQVVCENCGS